MHRILIVATGATLAVAATACDLPSVPKDSAGATIPVFGGGGTTTSGQRPAGLDTLPAPAIPAGSTITIPVALWTLADSVGSASITVGNLINGIVPNVNCFTEPNPAVSPWVSVPEGGVLPSAFCMRTVVGDSTYVVFRFLGRGVYAAVVARR